MTLFSRFKLSGRFRALKSPNFFVTFVVIVVVINVDPSGTNALITETAVAVAFYE